VGVNSLADETSGASVSLRDENDAVTNGFMSDSEQSQNEESAATLSPAFMKSFLGGQIPEDSQEKEEDNALLDHLEQVEP